MARLTLHANAKKLFTPFVLVSLALQLIPSEPAFAAKQKPLSIPVYSQLNQGAGPETHDVASGDSGSASGASSSTGGDSSQAAAAAAPDLSPVKLDSPAATTTAAPTPPAESTSEAAGSGTTPAAQAEGSGEVGQVLNATVNKDEFVPKAPVDRTDLVIGEPAKKGTKKEELDKQTKELGRKLGPVQLQESESETEKKTATVVDAEKAELADLWDAALCRNQDIQFVVQKLMPAKDPKHTTAVMMKMLSTAMYGAMCASSMAMPSGMSGGSMQGMYMAQNAGAGLVMNVLNGAAAKSAKKAAVTETEAIMLYNIIRNVAEKVVENFHEYKKNRSSVERGYQDYQDLQNMVSEARSGQDSAKQIEMEYTLRKARRDIDAINDDVRRCRQALVDLSGPESVDKLDKQIAIEMDKVDDATGTDTTIADDQKIPSM
ncbi:MAG TPA: hypothetical protein V6C97_07160 [Oculatellaceae cyanobacterium]